MDNTDRTDLITNALALQRSFFTSPNLCEPSAIGRSEDNRRLYQESLRRHATGACDRAILLPFRGQNSSVTTWYACAPTLQMTRALREEVHAFLGPSYVTERPLRRASDEADLHALILISRSGWHSIRFDSKDDKSDEMVLRQWCLYEELLQRRPLNPAYVPTSFHQLRASFDRSLQAGNEVAARNAMAAMRERFGISAENQRFLEIRLNAALGRWDLIADDPLLHDLTHLQLPPETYGDVLEGLYRVHVRPYESASDLSHLLEQFSESIGTPAQALFRTRGTSRRPEVLKSFVLYELLQRDPQYSVCSGLLDELPVGAFGELDGLLRERCAQSSSTDDAILANAALQNEQFDRAWDLFWSLPDSVDVLRALIACAREISDPFKTNEILERLESSSSEIRQAVEEASTTRLSNLRASYHAPLKPKNIREQFYRQSDEPVDVYIDRLTEFVRSVSPDELLAESGIASVAANCLMSLAIDDAILLERVFPLWHELFFDRIEPVRSLVPLYLEMLEVLHVRDVFQQTDLELLHQIMLAIVAVGDEVAYTKAVDTVTKVFDAVKSPQVLGWGLDVCDSLALCRSRDGDARLRLLTAVLQACREFSTRLTLFQIQQLKILASEAQIEFPALMAPVKEDADAATLQDVPQRIVFYSLDESSIRRAVDALQPIYPKWTIETNSDQVCSDRLKSLAQRASVFVFAWKCSKHAAYYCVKANSSKENLVMARGIGTSSLVSAVLEHLKLRDTSY